MTTGPTPTDVIGPLLEAGESAGCINLSEFSAAVQELDLEEDELEKLYAELDERGIELTDDCSRDTQAEATYVNGDLAHATTAAVSSG